MSGAHGQITQWSKIIIQRTEGSGEESWATGK